MTETKKVSPELKKLLTARDAYKRILATDDSFREYLDNEWLQNEAQNKLANMPRSMRKRAGLRLDIGEPPKRSEDFLKNRRNIYEGRLKDIEKQIEQYDDRNK